MARLPDLLLMAKEFGIKIISIKDLIEYRLTAETLIHREIAVKMPTEWGDFDMIAYTQGRIPASITWHWLKGPGNRATLSWCACIVRALQEIFSDRVVAIAGRSCIKQWK